MLNEANVEAVERFPDLDLYTVEEFRALCKTLSDEEAGLALADRARAFSEQALGDLSRPKGPYEYQTVLKGPKLSRAEEEQQAEEARFAKIVMEGIMSGRLTPKQVVGSDLKRHLAPEEVERLRAQTAVEEEIARKVAEDQGGDTKTSSPSRFGPKEEPADGYQAFDHVRSKRA